MIFFHNFEGLVRIFAVAIIFYGAFLVFLRISGKRSTSQMNNFDWLITVSLASMLGTTILIDKVVILEGLLAAGILIAFNVGLTKLSFYAPESRPTLYGKPTLLFFRGKFLFDQMERERVSENEILSAIRNGGYGSLRRVGAVILETNASLSVLPLEDLEEDGGSNPLLKNVRGFPEAIPSD